MKVRNLLGLQSPTQHAISINPHPALPSSKVIRFQRVRQSKSTLINLDCSLHRFVSLNSLVTAFMRHLTTPSHPQTLSMK